MYVVGGLILDCIGAEMPAFRIARIAALRISS